ncbi:phage integrase SAM-like domain-containing protein [Bacillus cereus]|uniref:phage integrase SAM-like domain-containing protein n=1 Tax=Bacillus cereus TaxID=1396 RepID=UPI0029D41236|nr:phage integrase SAM-like domain-containing protein [Bacillus cereus]
MPESAQTVGLTDETIASRIKRLKTFINWCLRQEIISKNPFNKFEGFRKDHSQIDILSIDELNNLLRWQNRTPIKVSNIFVTMYCYTFSLMACFV